jgi:intron-binding protein aquarius
LGNHLLIHSYPASSIAILTTYNGQKELIYDVLHRRCGDGTVFAGKFPRLSTVDKFQGQQADYVLLSLVRTKFVGHLQDVRRLVVALSRSRLGLYVFGRWKLFNDCEELSSAFKTFALRPTDNLALCQNEVFPKFAKTRKNVSIGSISDMKKHIEALKRTSSMPN